jgi:hypothetical protein
VYFLIIEIILRKCIYFTATEESPGFRLQRDPESKLFVMEVSNQRYVWKIFIQEFPKGKIKPFFMKCDCKSNYCRKGEKSSLWEI